MKKNFMPYPAGLESFCKNIDMCRKVVYGLTYRDVTSYIGLPESTMITYDTKGGINNQNNPISYNIEMGKIQLYSADKEYYDFTGWSFNDQVVSIIDTSICQNILLSANYTPTIYKINYVLNGGQNSLDNPVSYTIESEIIDLIPATFNNESVSRWYLESDFINRITRIKNGSHGDITLYARAGYDGFDTCNIENNILVSLNKSFIEEFSIDRIIIPNSVNCIGQKSNNDMIYLPQLISVNFIKGSCFDGVFYGYKNITYVEIPDSVSIIQDYTFLGCIGLTTVKLSKNINIISNGAFIDCKNLSNILYDDLLEVGNYAFLGCEKLSNIIVSEETKRIGDGAFARCTGLTNVEIPDSVLSMGMGVFEKCINIKQIKLSDNLNEIPDYTFCMCKGIEEFIVSDNIINIGIGAFEYCNNLSNIIIPNSVKYIGKITEDYQLNSGSTFAFTNLSHVIIPSSVTYTGSYIFAGCSDIVVYCEHTKEQDNWNNMWEWDITGIREQSIAYWYSESAPEQEGNFWHYVNDIATKW